jgi:hypothetical protein
MARQPFVEESVFAADQVENAAVLQHDVSEEEFRLFEHRSPQVIVEIREAIPVGLHRLQAANFQPLPGEILRQRRGLRVFQHPPHLRRQHGRPS